MSQVSFWTNWQSPKKWFGLEQGAWEKSTRIFVFALPRWGRVLIFEVMLCILVLIQMINGNFIYFLKPQSIFFSKWLLKQEPMLPWPVCKDGEPRELKVKFAALTAPFKPSCLLLIGPEKPKAFPCPFYGFTSVRLLPAQENVRLSDL